MKVLIECKACSGTGVYEGFAEPKGTGVVCLDCGGSGAVELSYTPYTGRKTKRGIHWVAQSRGGFIGTGVGPVPGSSMEYKEFLKLYPEAEVMD